MGIEDGTTIFTLSREIEYSAGGSSELTNRIVLKEPGMDHVKHYLKLKQMITRSQMELAKQMGDFNKVRESMPVGEIVKPLHEDVEAIESASEELDEAISLALQAADNIDIGDFIDTFRDMACMKGRTSICMIDGRRAMTTALWAKLKPDDAFNMAVRWCSFFAMPFEKGAPNISDQPSESHTGRTAA